MAAGYEDIENWSRQQNNLLDEQEQKQNEIIHIRKILQKL